MKAEYQRVLQQSDFDRFARLSRDDNPIHCNPEFAARSHFGATVAHGMLLYACICKGLTELAPATGLLQIEQSLMFPLPTFAGDRIAVGVTVETATDGILEIATSVSKPGRDGKMQTTALGRTRAVRRGIAPAAPGPLSTESGGAEFYGLRLGMMASDTRTFSAADLDEYGELIDDRNPVFADAAAARRSGYRDRVVPGPLLAGMFSCLLGTRLPGRGTGWMKQTLCFPEPAYPGDELTATVMIRRLRADKELVNLTTRITADDRRVVCDGAALVLVRNLENKLGIEA